MASFTVWHQSGPVPWPTQCRQLPETKGARVFQIQDTGIGAARGSFKKQNTITRSYESGLLALLGAMRRRTEPGLRSNHPLGSDPKRKACLRAFLDHSPNS